MKRASFLFSLALGAIVAEAARALDLLADTMKVVARGFNAARDWLIGASLAFAKAASASTTGPRLVGFVQAKAFVQRVIKRERPVIRAEWRMCPSV